MRIPKSTASNRWCRGYTYRNSRTTSFRVRSCPCCFNFRTNVCARSESTASPATLLNSGTWKHISTNWTVDVLTGSSAWVFHRSSKMQGHTSSFVADWKVVKISAACHRVCGLRVSLSKKIRWLSHYFHAVDVRFCFRIEKLYTTRWSIICWW